MIPLVNLPRQYEQLAAEIDAAIRDVCTHGDFILGRAVERFERAFADYIGVRHCIGVASGTDALQLALRALGVGPGDEVVLPSFSFIATAQAVWSCGATPIVVDCDVLTATIDPADAQRAITARTKVLLPVHLYGQPANLDALGRIAHDGHLHVVEDAAQAHGACHRGRRCGSIGAAAAFSFYPGKNLGAYGDAGAVTTDDDGLAGELRALRNLGVFRDKYVHARSGINSRLDTMQAAVLEVKLPYLDSWNDRRSEVAARYRDALRHLSPRVEPLEQAPWTTRHAHHLFVVRVRGGMRDDVARAMTARGIGVGIHYPFAIHQQPVFHARFGDGRDLPATKALAAECLSLPICGAISGDEVSTVVSELERAVEALEPRLE
jgi:dTDP-3-amino-3,4,6-trideoxy-alpha-D-glucose transaminase